MQAIGIVKEIWRYPVKSMRGERLETATLRWQGIEGDRQYAFLRTANGSRFPWLTGRELPELVTWSARYAEPDNPRGSKLLVRLDTTEYEIGDPALHARLSAAAGEDIRPLQSGRGLFDTVPLSVLSTATVTGVGTSLGQPVDGRRYRANIVIEPADPAARETAWLGRALSFGDTDDAVQVRIDAPIDRCAMVTIDPDTADRDPAVMRCVAQDFSNEISAGATAVRTGKIAAGMPVYRVG